MSDDRRAISIPIPGGRIEALLLPHAVARTDAPITMTVAEKRRDQGARKRIVSLSNARILASYKNHGIQG